MTKEEVVAVVQRMNETLPEKVCKHLEGVDVIVSGNAAEALDVMREEFDEDPADPFALPADCRAMFMGDGMEVEDDGEDGEVVSLPDGVIFLIADVIKDAAECALLLMHEVGHALGMDEDEVRNLGIGADVVTEAPVKAEGVTT